jgi:hypothetical protein
MQPGESPLRLFTMKRMKEMKKEKSLLQALHVLHGDYAVCGWHLLHADTNPKEYKRRNQHLTHT